ncbi:MAG: gamma-glutamyltransferase family protein [Myxococcales bacterium]|nr:gamma-glutamyltransferase family protein [Myxococcales bacterium]
MRHRVVFESRRSPLLSTAGCVATSHPLAAQAGLELLRAGGNAADAAVATAAALNVVEPTSTGIGGDCFALFYEGSTRRVHAVNGSGRAPAALSVEVLEARGFTREMPRLGVHTVTVPGAAAGWADTLSRHGRRSLSEVLAPAIRIATEGHAVAPIVAQAWRGSEGLLQQASPHGDELLFEGRAPRAGEIWRNPGLAGVFTELAAGGPEAFYRGRAGRAMLDVVESLEGLLAAGDLAAHRSSFEAPISTNYRDYTVYECAPNGQGLTALLALNLLEGFDLSAHERRGAAYQHLLIESLRLAFADTRWYVADPAFSPVPVEALLSKAYAAERRRLIDPSKASVDPVHGAPVSQSDTVYLCAADSDGNACSFINSNYAGFGTGIVPAGCGFTLQNRGAGFRLEPGHPNRLEPRKRPYHTIIPALSTRANGELHAAFGVMGGFVQPQGHVQVFLNLVEHGMDPQNALDAPRFSIWSDPPRGEVFLEDAISAEAQRGLAERGHRIRVFGDLARTGVFGRGQVILRDPETGVLWAGSDPRADGAAVAL